VHPPSRVCAETHRFLRVHRIAFGVAPDVTCAERCRDSLQCVAQLQSKLRNIVRAAEKRGSAGVIFRAAAIYSCRCDLSRVIRLDQPVELSREVERHSGGQLGAVTAVLNGHYLALVMRA
jgi:hypothetical protein